MGKKSQVRVWAVVHVQRPAGAELCCSSVSSITTRLPGGLDESLQEPRWTWTWTWTWTGAHNKRGSKCAKIDLVLNIKKHPTAGSTVLKEVSDFKYLIQSTEQDPKVHPEGGFVIFRVVRSFHKDGQFKRNSCVSTVKGCELLTADPYSPDQCDSLRHAMPV